MHQHNPHRLKPEMFHVIKVLAARRVAMQDVATVVAAIQVVATVVAATVVAVARLVNNFG